MKKLWTVLGALLLMASVAGAEVRIDSGKFVFNGVKQEMVWGRSCFKLSNIVTYHFSGNGGGKYNLGYARQWVDFNTNLGFDACRVLLETDGWDNCESGAQANDGVPQNCMFGSEPTDQGFWHVPTLQGGSRPTEMHGIGKQTLRWFYQTSQETGMMFELVVVATLKHNDVTVQQQGHVIRQTLAEGRKLQIEFPRALIIFNVINEWNAHSEWELAGVDGVNMLAVRADRWKHVESGQTKLSHTSPGPGFEAEQCPECVVIVDGGGGDTFDYEVGPEPGKFHGGFVHPSRDADWFTFPNAQQKQALVTDSRGMPWGITESMYYVEPEDEARGRQWYRTSGDTLNGWTTNFGLYSQFLNHHKTAGMAYDVVHDEKGTECDTQWPRPMTRVDQWALENLGGVILPPPPPPPTLVHYDHVIEAMYQKILKRGVDPTGLQIYNEWLRGCFADPRQSLCLAQVENSLVTSAEYNIRFTR